MITNNIEVQRVIEGYLKQYTPINARHATSLADTITNDLMTQKLIAPNKVGETAYGDSVVSYSDTSAEVENDRVRVLRQQFQDEIGLLWEHVHKLELKKCPCQYLIG